ncbi:MAG TPA: hypothetical protein VH144_03650 [Candidatus Saccharimonadales bacterium]|jgi:predicted DNA-binding protein with PD1-like motif|nr:hypothetical protein [Candidatus Saccharimonadales bacterium]
MKIHTFRLKPNKDLKTEIEKFVKTTGIKAGRSFGGHPKEGIIIYPTAEIVIGEDETVAYIRAMDEETGFPELEVKHV